MQQVRDMLDVWACGSNLAPFSRPFNTYFLRPYLRLLDTFWKAFSNTVFNVLFKAFWRPLETGSQIRSRRTQKIFQAATVSAKSMSLMPQIALKLPHACLVAQERWEGKGFLLVFCEGILDKYRGEARRAVCTIVVIRGPVGYAICFLLVWLVSSKAVVKWFISLFFEGKPFFCITKALSNSKASCCILAESLTYRRVDWSCLVRPSAVSDHLAWPLACYWLIHGLTSPCVCTELQCRQNEWRLLWKSEGLFVCALLMKQNLEMILSSWSTWSCRPTVVSPN